MEWASALQAFLVSEQSYFEEFGIGSAATSLIDIFLHSHYLSA